MMISFVVALSCEAAPIIDRFSLKRLDQELAFPVFVGESARLIVSGVGKAASASAATCLAEQPCNEPSVWMNVGIGGHASCEIGQGLLAHKIIDQATQESWYPPLVFEPPCPTAAIVTVDRPQRDYDEAAVYEMEAAGFYAAATRFATAELVHSYKVVSDNKNFSTHNINAKWVRELIESKVDEVATIAAALEELASEISARDVPKAQLLSFTERWHFTATQKIQLERLLQRMAIVLPGQDPLLDLPGSISSTAEVLKQLRETIEHAPVTFAAHEARR